MEITIKLTEKQMDDAMRAAEAKACKEWFENDEKKYADWAGDIVGDVLLNFLDELDMKSNIKITTDVW